MLQIINEKVENGFITRKYRGEGGEEVVIKALIPPETEDVIAEPQTSMEDMQAQTLVNTEYLVIMSELANL